MLIYKPNLTLIKDGNEEYRDEATFEEVIELILYGGYQKIIVNARVHNQMDMAIYYLIGQKKNVHIEELDYSDVPDFSDVLKDLC